MCAVSASAEVVVFDFSKPTELTPAVTPAESGGVDINTTFTGGDISLVAENAESKLKLWTSNGSTELRVYKGAQLQLVSPADKPITKVEIVGKDANKATYNGENITSSTWVGSTSSLTIAAEAAQYRVTTLTVTYGESGGEEPSAPEYTAISALKAAATETATAVNYKFADLLVAGVGRSGSNYSVYVTDGTEGMLLYGNNTLGVKAGDKISGTVAGELVLYNGLTEIQKADYSAVSVSSSDNAVTPLAVAIATIKAATDKTYENLLVRLENISFKATALSSRNISMTDADGNELTLRDNFNVLGDYIFTTDKTYNVTGFVTYYRGTPQLYVLSADDVELITNLKDPETAWASEIVAQEPGSTFTPNVLTTLSDGAKTFTSSNEAVATVDAEGNVTLTGYGVATITVVTAETDTYLASQAGYTLYNIKGEGTLENPYIASDLGFYKGKVSDKVWVKGTILGSYANGGVIAAEPQVSNLALGSADFFVPVQLSTGSEDMKTVRTDLNPKDNPDNVGKEVYIYGQIVEYFSTAGIKNTSDYSWDGHKGVTSITGVTTDTDANAAVYTIDGRRAVKAGRGLYIIGGRKVYVK